MPNYFQFNRGHEKAVPQNEVELQFLNELGLAHEVSANRWHPLFEAVREMSAYFGPNEEKINSCLARIKADDASRPKPEIPELWYDLVKQYMLGEKFTVEAWYSPV